jgi:hypothetical protein
VARYLRRAVRRGDPGQKWLAFLEDHREVICLRFLYRADGDVPSVLQTVENRRVQSRTHRPVGGRPTEVKRLRPRSWGGAVARKQDGGALRQHTQKGVCATHQVATCSERRGSLVTRISGG